MSDITPDTISAPEAARTIGLPYRTFVNHIKAGAVRAEQDASGEWRIPRAEVERLASERAVKRADAFVWQAAAQLVCEVVAAMRDENNANAQALAERLIGAVVGSAEWKQACDEMRISLAETIGFDSMERKVAHQVQALAYTKAREMAGRGGVDFTSTTLAR